MFIMENVCLIRAIIFNRNNKEFVGLATFNNKLFIESRDEQREGTKMLMGLHVLP
jgi:hypothetical protein